MQKACNQDIYLLVRSLCDFPGITTTVRLEQVIYSVAHYPAMSQVFIVSPQTEVRKNLWDTAE